jgi:hypothetical protein
MEEGDADAILPHLVQCRSVVVTGSKGTHAAVPVKPAFAAGLVWHLGIFKFEVLQNDSNI